MLCALVSMDQEWLDKEVNRTRCAELTKTANAAGCSLVVFPEMTLTGYSLDVSAIAEEETTSYSLRWFGDLARAKHVSIIFGACLTRPEWDRPRNTLCLARPDGSAIRIYDKIHPFSFVGEDRVFGAGEGVTVVEVDGVRLGVAICYDLRFPEIYSAMADRCDAVVTIANWPTRRIGHWRALLLARAIENQCYSIGVNRIGVDGNGLSYVKSSMTLSPQGDMLEPVQVSQELDIYVIEPAVVQRYRDEFPTLRDKRYSLYQRLWSGSIC